MPDVARILVVDDSIPNREVLKGLLASGGHQVVGEAATGQEAVGLYDSLRPDVVVMDLVMPDMNGCDAARAILRTHPGARIVATSGLSQPSVQGDAEEAGMVGFVPKPIEAPELLAEIAEALASA